MSEKIIAVALSGGVDSSVAAAFLKEKGCQVVGITMEPWLEEKQHDVADAARVAAHLQIEHRVVSFRDSFRREVIDYLVNEYGRGRTPNPCAVCNPLIKFGGLLKICDEIGAEKLATGHYAIVSPDRRTGRIVLKRGREHDKDQSYFLARLSQDTLRRTLFPVGRYPKKRIRLLAERFGIPVAQKSESQEACFIPEGQIVSFIEQQAGRSFPSGEIVDRSGRVVGEHKGIIGYTIGQRKGLGIALGFPVYVTEIDGKNNRIVIGSNEDLYRKTFTASDPNWIAVSGVSKKMNVSARIRYMHKPAPAVLAPLADGRVQVTFRTGQRAVTPGQLAVFYKRESVVGSAWID